MNTIDLDDCQDVNGGWMLPFHCDPIRPFPVPLIPDWLDGGPIAITAWFPVCALVD
jgi:hypothetical protein